MVENVLLENDNKRGCRNCGGIGNGNGIILVAIVVAVSRQGTLAAFAGVVVGVFVAA
jgi:hypothetical protein